MTRTSREVMLYRLVVLIAVWSLCCRSVVESTCCAQVRRGDVYDEAIVGAMLVSSMSGNQQAPATI